MTTNHAAGKQSSRRWWMLSATLLVVSSVALIYGVFHPAVEVRVSIGNLADQFLKLLRFGSAPTHSHSILSAICSLIASGGLNVVWAILLAFFSLGIPLAKHLCVLSNLTTARAASQNAQKILSAAWAITFLDVVVLSLLLVSAMHVPIPFIKIKIEPTMAVASFALSVVLSNILLHDLKHTCEATLSFIQAAWRRFGHSIRWIFIPLATCALAVFGLFLLFRGDTLSQLRDRNVQLNLVAGALEVDLRNSSPTEDCLFLVSRLDNVQKLHCHREMSYEDVKRLLDAHGKTLTHLDLRGNRNVGLSTVILIRTCRNLIDLELSDTNITDRCFLQIAALQHLSTLSVAGCEITDVALGYLRRHNCIRTLRLGNTRISGIGLSDLSTIDTLTHVSVAKCKCLKDEAWFYLGQLRHLESLDICETPAFSGNKLVYLPGALKKIMMSRNDLNPAAIVSVATFGEALGLLDENGDKIAIN